jgi:hypothetical protein
MPRSFYKEVITLPKLVGDDVMRERIQRCLQSGAKISYNWFVTPILSGVGQLYQIQKAKSRHPKPNECFPKKKSLSTHYPNSTVKCPLKPFMSRLKGLDLPFHWNVQCPLTSEEELSDQPTAHTQAKVMEI